MFRPKWEIDKTEGWADISGHFLWGSLKFNLQFMLNKLQSGTSHFQTYLTTNCACVVHLHCTIENFICLIKSGSLISMILIQMEYNRLSSVNKIIHKKNPSRWGTSCSKVSKAVPSCQARKERRYIIPTACTVNLESFIVRIFFHSWWQLWKLIL